MPNRVLALPVLLLIASLIAAMDAAAAPLQRTFVASYGNDANPCSRATPCRGFTAAVAQTTPGGEVIVLDSAGYGPVTITQSVSIVAPPGIYAGISVITPGSDGIAVNGGAIDVVLSGLSIVGLGGSSGINMMAARTLRIDRCMISSMIGAGIKAMASGGTLTVSNTEVRGNGSGIVANGTLVAQVDHTHIVDSGAQGVAVFYGATMQLSNSIISSSGNNGIVLQSGAGTPVRASITDTRIDHSHSYGIALYAPVASSTVQISLSDVSVTDSQLEGIDAQASAAGGSISIDGRGVTSKYNHQGGIVLAASSGGSCEAVFADSAIADNLTIGLGLNAVNGGTIRAVISSSQLRGNGSGVQLNESGAAQTFAKLAISRSVIARNGTGVLAQSDGGGGTSYVSVTDSEISDNFGDGIAVQGVGANAIAQRNTITGNGVVGLHIYTGGIIATGADNASRDNKGGDVIGTLTPLTFY